MADIQPDNMNVYKIVNSVFSSNTFVLTSLGSNYCWIVDIGDIRPIISYIQGQSVRGGYL